MCGRVADVVTIFSQRRWTRHAVQAGCGTLAISDIILYRESTVLTTILESRECLRDE